MIENVKIIRVNSLPSSPLYEELDQYMGEQEFVLLNEHEDFPEITKLVEENNEQIYGVCR